MRLKLTIAAGCCIAALGAGALTVSAETVQLAGASTRTNSGANRAPPTTTMPPRAYVPSTPSYGQRVEPAPSVDNNPIGDRGQSLYPPRATTDTSR